MGRQVDVTSKTEGAAFADSTGVPLLVKYDARLRENVAKGIVEEVNTSVQVGTWGACSQGTAGACRALCRCLNASHACTIMQCHPHLIAPTGLQLLSLALVAISQLAIL